jgi:hypothetical protein
MRLTYLNSRSNIAEHGMGVKRLVHTGRSCFQDVFCSRARFGRPRLSSRLTGLSKKTTSLDFVGPKFATECRFCCV